MWNRAAGEVQCLRNRRPQARHCWHGFGTSIHTVSGAQQTKAGGVSMSGHGPSCCHCASTGSSLPRAHIQQMRDIAKVPLTSPISLRSGSAQLSESRRCSASEFITADLGEKESFAPSDFRILIDGCPHEGPMSYLLQCQCSARHFGGGANDRSQVRHVSYHRVLHCPWCSASRQQLLKQVSIFHGSRRLVQVCNHGVFNLVCATNANLCPGTSSCL